MYTEKWKIKANIKGQHAVKGQQAGLLSYYILKKKSESHSVAAPWTIYSPWSSPGQNTEWVAFPFSRGSSQSRDQTQVSHIAGRFFTS